MIASLTIALAAGVPARPDLAALERRLDGISRNFAGRLGYRLTVLGADGSRQSIGERDDERFPSASTIKTMVMYEAYRQIEEGRLSLDTQVPLWEKARRHSSLWASYLDEGLKVDIDGLISLMMSYSDNTATVVLAEKVGARAIKARMEGLGYRNTYWTSYPPQEDLQLVRLRQTFANMGVTSPAEMNDFLVRLATGRGIGLSEAARQKMIRVMSRQYWDDFISYNVPPDVVVASKVGALNRSRSDTAIVFGPRPYVLTVYTDNQKDRRWVSDNAGDEAIRRISGLVWNSINPDRPYSPPKDAKKWAPTGGSVE